MRRAVISAGILVALTSLVACGSSASDDEPGEQVVYVEVPRDSGNDVPCVIYDSNNYAGGLSCDWNEPVDEFE